MKKLIIISILSVFFINGFSRTNEYKDIEKIDRIELSEIQIISDNLFTPDYSVGIPLKKYRTLVSGSIFLGAGGLLMFASQAFHLCNIAFPLYGTLAVFTIHTVRYIILIKKEGGTIF